MSQARQLALRLYGLHAQDRAWLLSRLDEGARHQLQCLLGEIKAIGLNPGADFLVATQSAALPAFPDATEAAIGVDSASASQVQQVFDREPQGMQRCLAGMHAWSWISDLSQVRNEPNSFLYQSNAPARLTPRARAALMSAFAAQLAQTSHMPPGPGESRSDKSPSLLVSAKRLGKWLR